jgi:hypothetical protein
VKRDEEATRIETTRHKRFNLEGGPRADKKPVWGRNSIIVLTLMVVRRLVWFWFAYLAMLGLVT